MFPRVSVFTLGRLALSLASSSHLFCVPLSSLSVALLIPFILARSCLVAGPCVASAHVRIWYHFHSFTSPFNLHRFPPSPLSRFNRLPHVAPFLASSSVRAGSCVSPLALVGLAWPAAATFPCATCGRPRRPRVCLPAHSCCPDLQPWAFCRSFVHV